jgi:hypothetical protein
MMRPWLQKDAEAAGKFAVAIIRKKRRQWRDDDAATAEYCARWAAHWGRLALGQS